MFWTGKRTIELLLNTNKEHTSHSMQTLNLIEKIPSEMCTMGEKASFRHSYNYPSIKSYIILISHSNQSPLIEIWTENCEGIWGAIMMKMVRVGTFGSSETDFRNRNSLKHFSRYERGGCFHIIWVERAILWNWSCLWAFIYCHNCAHVIHFEWRLGEPYFSFLDIEVWS